jgi:hypothetical protein
VERLSNAVKFTPDAGWIQVETHRDGAFIQIRAGACEAVPTFCHAIVEPTHACERPTWQTCRGASLGCGCGGVIEPCARSAGPSRFDAVDHEPFVGGSASLFICNGTVTTTFAEASFPERSSARTVIVYCRPSLSYLRREACSSTVKA